MMATCVLAGAASSKSRLLNVSPAPLCPRLAVMIGFTSMTGRQTNGQMASVTETGFYMRPHSDVSEASPK